MKLVFREGLFSSQSANHTGMFKMGICMLILLALYLALQVHPALADSTKLPGVDASSQMESAGTLLRFIDTGIFKWGARLLAGLCIFGAAWSLKEGRYGPAVISVISAILFGTAPTWVRDIFTVGGSDSVFTSIERPVHDSVVGRLDAEVIRHV
jgi:hypothetical protein